MAEARLKKKDKQYEQLVQGSSKLHSDIKDLESAYILHRQIVEEDQNNVRGKIRKEIGGSRWEHGGAGKLRTYKSKKDLVDQKTKVLKKDDDRNLQINQANQNSSENNTGTQSLCRNEQTFETSSSTGKTDKILDLKTKVLKKASSHIIRRDTWSAHSDTVADKPVKYKAPVDKEEKRKSKGKNGHVNGDISLPKPQKPVKRSNSLKRETNESSRSPSYTTQKLIENKQKKNNGQTNKKETNESVSAPSGNQLQRRSRIDLFKDSEQTARSLNISVDRLSEDTNENGVHKRTELERTSGVTYTPRLLQEYSDRVVENGVSQRIFPTQPLEPAEIYIDPRKGQVRIIGGHEGNFNGISSLDGTKVLVQPGSLHNSVDGNRLACSVVDDNSDSSPRREIRDIFGIESFNTRQRETATKHVTSTSPFATTRQCNTEVEFWLRGLGLPDVDRYVKIFADNEIDLTDLEFMSAGQLHDMGVTAFGALDRILKGIRDLKNQPATRVVGIGGDRLQSSSIAWEQTDPELSKGLSSDKSNYKASKVTKGNSCHSETFVKQSGDFSVLGNTENENERCSSVLSAVMDNVDAPPHSARSDTPSFAASTKSSSAKYTEKRPPSAKTKSGNKSKNNSSQSQTKNLNSSVKLKRNNSDVSEKIVSKLSNLDVKPTKGVLLRPRSSSLTRESARGGRETQSKKVEEKKEPRQLRSRSRSADVVKRKALEGVNAAAKKFEEKRLRTKDTDMSVPLLDERKKLRRDEMAARHLQREKYKEVITVDSGSSDTDEQMKKVVSHDTDRDQGLENLVTVNILSPPQKSDPQGSPSKHEGQGKTQVMKPEMRKSLRRLERERKQTYNTGRPIQLVTESDTEAPLLSTYKVSSKEKDRSQSEPESGYRTDGSTTYSQIEDRVSDIQMKIKRLKARATSGDEMTLTLVHDLQQQLSHFERQLKDKERELQGQQSDPESGGRVAESSRKQPADTNDSSNVSPISEALDESLQKFEEENTAKRDMAVRMSKRELIDEMRKEKQQHHRQIRQLQSELHKFRHSDPVTSLELEQKDITYKQDDLIGEGTFSCVYKGEFQGSEVAVKQLKMPLQQQDRNYFAAEVSLLKELRHPRVVLLIGVCTTTKLPLMVLEYMSQGSLFNYLHNLECESLDHALYYQIARDIALGMNYLHSHRPEVLHLDLKSVNVLLCQSLRAKIADFGFSKLRLDAGLKSGKRTKTKSKAAAPAWMSPELLDKGEITGKSDVYSFAIILWEMLTRCTPYKDCTVFQILEKVRRNQRPGIPDGTPEGLSNLIKMCWDPNPAKRPQFKDVLQMLENLAFPPAWRELFQKAGVPDSALQDVQSTRTIISLVTGTLDSGKSGILHSFMVAHSEKNGKDAKKANIETKSAYRKEKTSSEKKQKSRLSSRSKTDTGRSSQSSRASHHVEDWDSDTVTTVSEKLSSDESELTLKNIRSDSSDENDLSFYSDDSSILTSGEDDIYSKPVNKQTIPKTEINVVIPNLELSLQSAREEFKAERERINRATADWVSVSLDDHTDRSDKGKRGTDLRKDIKSDLEDMRLTLSSSLSNRSQSPRSSMNISNSSLNESARRKRRDQNRYSEEFLMRESFHNRRPPSPKKKSLTKKFMEHPEKHIDHDHTTNCDDRNRIGVSVDTKRDSNRNCVENGTFVEKSYDSFFDLSSQRRGVNHVSLNKDNSTSMDNVHIGSRTRKIGSIEPARTSLTNGQSKIWGINDENELCVEDMENEVENELSRREPVESVKYFKSEPSGRNLASDSCTVAEFENQNKKTGFANVGTLNKTDVTGNEKIAGKKTGNSDWSGESTLYLKTNHEKVIRNGKSFELPNDHYTPQHFVTEGTNENNSAVISRSVDSYTGAHSEKNDYTLTDQCRHLEKESADLSKSRCKRVIPMESVSGDGRKYGTKKSATNEKIVSPARQNQSDGDNNDNIRVVLQTMLASKDENIKRSVGEPIETLERKHSIDRNTEQISDKPYEKTIHGNDNKTDDIRVKLDLNEIDEKKKKPTITPRKSLMSSNRSETLSKDILTEHTVNVDEIYSVHANKKNNSGIPQQNSVEDISIFKQTQEENKPNHGRHDGGSEPNVGTIISKPTTDKRKISVEAHGRNKKAAEIIPSPKKSTIRVKLRKDPLAPSKVAHTPEKIVDPSAFTAKPSSPVPPAPPPPPLDITKSLSSVGRIVKDNAPRGSMADELKLRLANRQSISEGMLHRNKRKNNTMVFSKALGNSSRDSEQPGGEPRLVKISEIGENIAPQQSEGLPSFVVQSLDLQDQKDQLRSITKAHPNQIDDLSNASQEQLISIAEILKKAVLGRRLALGEDGDSVSQSLESAATGWSIDL